MTTPSLANHPVLPQIKAQHALAAENEAQPLVDGLAVALAEQEREISPDG